MIDAFHAENYGCLRHVHATLTPLHAFIGPNDSGKSTLLHGMRTVVQVAGSSFKRGERGNWLPFDHFLPVRVPGTSLTSSATPQENGLHPARIAEVVRLLRSIVKEKGTQVVMATHSPLVVNELDPDEVSVVTRKPDEGTKVKRIKDTPDFEERFKIYALGELWIAYANGLDEAPLLSGTEP